MMLKLSPKTLLFWQEYLSSLKNINGVEQQLYEAFHIGNGEESANYGAKLIKEGIKIATSALLWEYQIANKPLPEVGSLSIVEDGKNEPVCIVETIEMEIKPFADIDSQFAYDYGEWDRTLASWRKHCWEYYVEYCRSLQKEPARDMPLVCERFQVVYS